MRATVSRDAAFFNRLRASPQLAVDPAGGHDVNLEDDAPAVSTEVPRVIIDALTTYIHQYALLLTVAVVGAVAAG